MTHSAKAFVHVTYEGHTLDNLTYAHFMHGAHVLGAMVNHSLTPLVPHMSQGCYTTSFPGSANTHARSGAMDIMPPPKVTYATMCRAYRMAGGTAFHRPVNWDGKGGIEHCHNIVIGDEMADPSAIDQVHDCYAGLNGLASHAPDKTWHPNPLMPFRYPMWQVSFKRVLGEAKATRHRPIPGVRHIQRCLNAKRGAQLAVDGIYGERTKNAYKRWEHQVGGEADGIPGIRSLVLLGASQFKVNA